MSSNKGITQQRGLKVDLTTLKWLYQNNDIQGINYQAITTMILNRFRSGAIHNYSIKKVAVLCRCSRATVREAVKWGIAKGVCTPDGSRMVFRRFVFNRNQKKRRGHRFTVHERSLMASLKQTKEIFRTALLVNKVHSLSHINHRSETTSPEVFHKRSIKVAERDTSGRTDARLSGLVGFQDALSYQGIAKTICMSPSSALRYATLARERKIIRRRRRLGKKKVTPKLLNKDSHIRHKVQNFYASHYGLSNLDSFGVFFYKGYLYYQPPNRWSVIQNK